MNDKNIQDDIYTAYQPNVLAVGKIRTSIYDTLMEFEALIKKLSNKIPFNDDLVHRLEELKNSLDNVNESRSLLECAEIISYFNKYGIPPIYQSKVSPTGLDSRTWKSLLTATLGDFPVDLCKKSGNIVNRARELLSGLYNKKGKFPNTTETETISLYNAIRHGTYAEMGILTWDDMMFMTFGRNYFKYKLEMKKNLLPEQEESNSLKRYHQMQKKEVLSLIQWYLTTLSLDDTLQPMISNAYDLIVNVLPKGTMLKRSKILAEIIIFHVLKEEKIFTDWDLFVVISPLGDMPMSRRKWLLRYKQYLPSKVAYRPRLESPDLYLRKLYESSKITDETKAVCEKNKQILIKSFKGIKPRTIAGIACYLALKKITEQSCSIAEALARMGIENPGSIINAVKSLKERREYRDDLFD